MLDSVTTSESPFIPLVSLYMKKKSWFVITTDTIEK